MIHNEQAFIPPVCPALDSHPKLRRKGGLIVTPDMFRINFLELDPDDQYRDALDVFIVAANDDCIDITQDRPPSHPGSEEVQNIEWAERLSLDDRASVELAIGEKYCDRISKCAGAIVCSDRTFACSALDEKALHPIISELRNQV